MEIHHLPIIDWELGLRLAGNKEDIAKDMLELLINSLPEEIALINTFSKDRNYSQLLKQLHRLHGAICYCGLPRLKLLVSRLETDLKNNIMFGLPSFLDQLNTEVNLLIEHHSRYLS